MYIFKNFCWLRNSPIENCGLVCVSTALWFWGNGIVLDEYDSYVFWNPSLFLHFYAFFMWGILDARIKFKCSSKLFFTFCLQFITSNKKLFLTITRVLEKSDQIGPHIFIQGHLARKKIPQPTYLINSHFSVEKELRDSNEVYCKSNINSGIDKKDNVYNS